MFYSSLLLTRTRWHFVGPGSVAHAKDDGMSTSYVTGFALKSNNRAVTSTTSVQDSYVRMRSLRQWSALRC